MYIIIKNATHKNILLRIHCNILYYKPRRITQKQSSFQSNNGRVAALVLLDLSAAFDTTDHSILIERLEHTHGISGDALKWMASYLRERNQQVIICDASLADVLLEYDVTQGSILGPKLYSLYTRPLGDVIERSPKQRLLFGTICPLALETLTAAPVFNGN